MNLSVNSRKLLSDRFMKRKPLILGLLCIAALSLGLERLYYRQNGGFSIGKITSPVLPSHVAHENLQDIDCLLEQPFHFLGSGGTSFAFLGEDGTTVLKLFKRQHFAAHGLFFHVCFPGIADVWRIHKILQREWQHQHKRQAFFFNSCQLAYQHLKEETGLLFLTLSPDLHFSRRVKLIDAWGVPHSFDLSRAEFAVQKKANLLYPVLEKLLKDGRQEEAKQAIDSLLKLISARCAKGIGDRDPNLLINFGFNDGKAIEIDLGSYYLKPELSSTFATAQELFLSTYALQKWLEKHSPDLLNYVRDQIAKVTILNETAR